MQELKIVVFSVINACRDCIRFLFMEFLQKELDEVSSMWNQHLIRYARSPQHISGIPNELYYIPELQGSIYLIYTSSCTFNLKANVFGKQGTGTTRVMWILGT